VQVFEQKFNIIAWVAHTDIVETKWT